MDTFLYRVAKAFADNLTPDELCDTCFVFPNKRSGTFFARHMETLTVSDTSAIMPQITTISDFIADLSQYTVASRYDQLFTLYTEYSRLSEGVEEFDQFVFWGDMLLADFNDVDMYMANPAELFRNLRNYKEIQSDYLTPEQKDVISRYWNIQLPASETEQFWTHLKKDGEHRENRESFLRLWEILDDLYRGFRQSLEERHLAFTGMQYREVAASLRHADALTSGLPPRVVMVGFNVLSVSEIKIFESLKRMGIGDFYWDFEFPDSFMPDNPATRFISRFAELFPSRYDIAPDGPTKMPDFNLVGVPSNIGQAKYTGALLQTMAADGTIHDPTDAIDTAIVLPSEDLFIDLLHSIPPELATVNITMGYPLRLTPMAELIGSITSMHLRARKVRDSWCFFYKDIESVLSNPLLNAVCPAECRDMARFLERERMFTIPAQRISDEFPKLAPVFYPVDNLMGAEEVMTYTLSLVDFLSDGMRRISTEENPRSLERGFLTRYRQSVDMLRNAIRRYGITMREHTFFHLLERTVQSETVNFVGEPLRGLQIMGVLETRCLSFDNVIMLSMNERVFPRKHFSGSFIPELLRGAYGMSTIEFQECMNSYYFYRLVSHAKNVTLVYDTRTEGTNSGDMSRYLYQLVQRVPKEHMRRTLTYYTLNPAERKVAISVPKTPEICQIIESFRNPQGTLPRKFLSASSINEYINCPLQFYFSHIEGIRVADEVVDYMDESEFGTILHKVAEQSYKRLRADGNAPLLVTKDVIGRLRRETVQLQQIITSAINQIHNRLPAQNADFDPQADNYVNLTPLTGENRLLGRVMEMLITTMFDREASHVPFYFVEGEQKFELSWEIIPGFAVNVKGSIDRVNSLPDGTVEIIDYKSGADDMDADSIEHLFKPKNATSGRCKALLQLFVYANAYSIMSGYSGPLKPTIYKFRTMASEGLVNPTIAKETLTDYRIYNHEVCQRLADELKPLFDDHTPFEPRPDWHHCQYCKYKSLCGQEATREF